MTEEICELCVHHPERRCLVEARGDLAIASPCSSCAAICEKCGNERILVGHDSRGYEYVSPCSCTRLLDRISYFNAARIPARYGHCTLVSFENKGGNQREVHRLTE